MTLSIRTAVKIFAFALACLLGMFLLEAVAYRIGIAQADNGSAVIAAGSGSDAVLAIPTTAITTAPVAAPVPPSTVTDVIADASQVSKLWHSGTIPCAIILAAFYLLTLARSSVKALQVGKVAAYVAAGVGVLAVAAASAANGQLPAIATLVGPLITGLALVTHPGGVA